MAYFVLKGYDQKHCKNFECDRSISKYDDCYGGNCECSCSHCINYNECMKNRDDYFKINY